MESTNFSIQLVDLVGQYRRLQVQINEAITKVLESGYFVGGPTVANFTRDLAAYNQVNHVITCANGTDALQLALMALNLQPGDEVIMPSFTFIATAEVVALLGLTPVAVDIPQTFNIDPAAVKQALSPKTKCIIPVHLFGQCAPMEEILELAQAYNLFVIEDNAQSIGAYYTFENGQRQPSGSMGHIGCTSFYPSKNLGAYGDAGALFTNHPDLAETIATLANHGQRNKYTSDLIGINSRLDALQAAILHVKLHHLDAFIEARQEVADFYDAALSGCANLTIPFRMPYSTHVFHQYTLIYNGDRDWLKAELQKRGIPTMVYYPVPIHLQPAYRQKYQWQNLHLPNSERLAKQVISLPMHTELTDKELTYIANTLIELCS
ncbi:MAG: DegT/DnrJ/EryC1/StrS family aminotransferase [Sphingobacteriales bacterium]|nr:DegT/DnrJ/EryC1/StrS family aminotransferase [Sphingobacteriales bacterium]